MNHIIKNKKIKGSNTMQKTDIILHPIGNNPYRLQNNRRCAKKIQKNQMTKQHQ